jgi:hypothetical protein
LKNAHCFPSGEMIMHGMGMITEEIIVDHIIVEVPSQEECQCVTHRVNLGSELAKANFDTLNLALVKDKFDV